MDVKVRFEEDGERVVYELDKATHAVLGMAAAWLTHSCGKEGAREVLEYYELTPGQLAGALMFLGGLAEKIGEAKKVQDAGKGGSVGGH